MYKTPGVACWLFVGVSKLVSESVSESAGSDSSALVTGRRVPAFESNSRRRSRRPPAFRQPESLEPRMASSSKEDGRSPALSGRRCEFPSWPASFTSMLSSTAGLGGQRSCPPSPNSPLHAKRGEGKGVRGPEAGDARPAASLNLTRIYRDERGLQLSEPSKGVWFPGF